MWAETPKTERELLERANALVGHSLGELAQRLAVTLPSTPKRHKGWIGQLIERALGTDAGNKNAPDFLTLGIELKTLPVTPQGCPVETTYVCRVPCRDLELVTWKTSGVYRKLRRVLWIPVDGESARVMAQRRIGAPLLWTLEDEDELLLQSDWESHMDMIRHGQIDAITARHGQFLQVRPKAANSHARRVAESQHGLAFETLPRGFYLRTGFTHRVLQRHFSLG